MVKDEAALERQVTSFTHMVKAANVDVLSCSKKYRRGKIRRSGTKGVRFHEMSKGSLCNEHLMNAGSAEMEFQTDIVFNCHAAEMLI